ncbi:MAG: hypothetical protein ACTIIH_12095, partial [Brevibacterium sp.]|uniref:hypothetical protein n=1 Tax=Brevibacterium sp. TaxID=1701 RepID=UPI003F9321FE
SNWPPSSRLTAPNKTDIQAGANDRRRDERTHRRELALRWSDRVAQLETATHALQRETLLALQDALQEVARLTGKTMHFDHMQARSGKYTQLPEDLSEAMHVAEIEVSQLAARVLDPQVRAAVKEFSEISTRLSVLSTDLRGLTGHTLENHMVA